MSPTSLWVSKFDVKLGVMIKIFKITAGRWFFIFWPKSSPFFFTSRWEAFFCKKLKKDGSWSKISNLQQVRDFSFLGLKVRSYKFKFKPSPPHHPHPPNPPHPPTPIHAPRLNRDYKRWYTLRINNYCIIKDFSVPSLARSVPKPLKVPSVMTPKIRLQ